MPDHEQLRERVADLVRGEDWTGIGQVFEDLHPADIADCIDQAPRDVHDRLFSLVPADLKPDVLGELEQVAGSDVLDSLSLPQLAQIAEEMPPDEAADVLGELPEHRSREILRLMHDKESEDIRRLLSYDDESAGGIMTTDVVAMREQQTVRDAIDAIAHMDEEERFVYAYVVDARHHLIGYAEIWDLLRERDPNKRLAALAHRNVISVTADTDQEEVARLMSQYDLTALPVTDTEGRLVGRVTIDDVVDVVMEEASEDIFRLAGSDDIELDSRSPLRSAAVRLPWLMITLAGGFVTSLILRRFHAHISDILILAAFVPIVLAMGGNTGIQSSTLVVRSIALGGMQGRGVFRLLARELLLGALMGCVCGTVIGFWARFLVAGNAPGFSATQLGAVVGMALFAAMVFAATFGALVPVVLHRMRVDPAVASGPFITMANDISALLIYFSVISLLLHRLG